MIDAVIPKGRVLFIVVSYVLGRVKILGGTIKRANFLSRVCKEYKLKLSDLARGLITDVM